MNYYGYTNYGNASSPLGVRPVYKLFYFFNLFSQPIKLSCCIYLFRNIRTKRELFVGWYYDLDNPSGDNYIDFDLPKTNEGKNANITIDFNVDGDITNRFKD